MRSFLVCLVAVTICVPGATREVTGSVHAYEIARGDTLTSIGARFGVDARTLARDNDLRPGAVLHPGNWLTVNNRHIAPLPRSEGIVVNIAQRMLFVVRDGGVIRAMPVAVGRADWRTPLGAFEIAVKEVDPVWDVPVSIQQEMARNRQPVLAKVPPGPANPLGNRWLGLSAAGVGIHGTNQPASIYQFATHGCIRVHPDDMLELFDLVSVGTPVELAYEPVLVAVSRDVTFVEVHRDVYRRLASSEVQLRQLLREAGIETLAGSAGIRRVLAEQAGHAVVIDDEDVLPTTDWRPPCDRSSGLR